MLRIPTLKEGNMLLVADESVLRAFEQEELNEPCPRKELEGRTIYLSREFSTPKDFGAPVLCNLGSAVGLDGAEHREDIQPYVYRALEVILDIPWTCSVDIWNVGCMVGVNGLHERSLLIFLYDENESEAKRRKADHDST
jgi:serine/threonine-protein kinase SRPK3